MMANRRRGVVPTDYGQVKSGCVVYDGDPSGSFG